MARELALEGALLSFTLLNRCVLLRQLLSRLRTRYLVSPQALRQLLLLCSQSAQAIIPLLQLKQEPKLITHCLRSSLRFNPHPTSSAGVNLTATPAASHCQPAGYGYPLHLAQWAHLVSNQGPTGYEPVALPTELWARHACRHHSTQNLAGRQGSVAGAVCRQELSTKLRSILLRLGWRSLRSAFASIWRTRSRVTSKS